MPDPIDLLEFTDRHHWRLWLANNHTTSREAWLILYKQKYRGSRLSLAAAVEEALCFGWIDGVLKPIDGQSYALRFSPRAPNSIWSLQNIRRVEELRLAGKMTPAGEASVAQAIQYGAWEAAARREQVDVIPSDLESALNAQPGALPAFLALPASRKKQLVYWLESAKRAETRQSRLQHILEELQSHLSGAGRS